MKIHDFNWKYLTIACGETPNTPGMLISRLNPEKKTGRWGEVCPDDAENAPCTW